MNTEKYIVIGKSSFSIEYLQSVTMLEAIEHFKSATHEDRIRNAWKRVNKKK